MKQEKKKYEVRLYKKTATDIDVKSDLQCIRYTYAVSKKQAIQNIAYSKNIKDGWGYDVGGNLSITYRYYAEEVKG